MLSACSVLLCFAVSLCLAADKTPLYQYKKIQDGYATYQYQLGGEINETDGWELITGANRDNNEISFAMMYTSTGSGVASSEYNLFQGVYNKNGVTLDTYFQTKRSASNLKDKIDELGGDYITNTVKTAGPFYRATSGVNIVSTDCTKDGVLAQHLGVVRSCPTGYRSASSTSQVVEYGIACKPILDPNSDIVVTETMSTTYIPKSLRFSCIYSQDYDMELTCDDGEWSDEVPVCPEKSNYSFFGDLLEELSKKTLPTDEDEAEAALAEIRALVQILEGMEVQLLETLGLPSRQP